MPDIAFNKRANFDYEISQKFEAGIELLGFEVKAAKSGRMNIAGSYAVIRDGQAWLLNADIPPYQPGNTPADYDPKRSRRLLLKNAEIKYLTGKSQEKGLTILPLRVYLRKGLVKLELGIGRSRKKQDKREVIRSREIQREISRHL
jgi:SsrA-binding protein